MLLGAVAKAVKAELKAVFVVDTMARNGAVNIKGLFRPVFESAVFFGITEDAHVIAHDYSAGNARFWCPFQSAVGLRKDGHRKDLSHVSVTS
jgi:hypothetical protein